MYTFDETTVDRLRAIYASPTRLQREARIAAMARTLGVPRWALTREARRHGWSIYRNPKSWRRWSAEDDARLRDGFGHRALITVAAELGRSVDAVRTRAYDLGLMTRIVDGYSLGDIRQCMGVSRERAARWITSGLLKVKDGRVTAESMERFLFSQAHRYDLACVDQVWFKSIVFARR